MEIKLDYDDEGYSYFNRFHDNCITITENGADFHYEFDVSGREATVKGDSLVYLREAVRFFHEHKPYVSRYANPDHSFYQAFDDAFTFKLPISILQPSKFFLNQEKLDEMPNYAEDDHIFYVDIISDEYVLLEDHTMLRYLAEEGVKMVNVVMKKHEAHIPDFVYICKEQNVRSITKLEILKKPAYEKYWNGFIKDYFNNEI